MSLGIRSFALLCALATSARAEEAKNRFQGPEYEGLRLAFPTLSPYLLGDIDTPHWAFPNLKGASEERAEFAASQILSNVYSWIFLMDASEDNPFASPRLQELYRQNPSCLRRLYFDLAEATLKKIEAPDEKHLAIIIVSRDLQHPQLHKPTFFHGTKSSKNRLVGPGLRTDFNEQLETELKWAGENLNPYTLDLKRRVDLPKLLSCDRSIIPELRSFYPWFDAGALNDIFSGLESDAAKEESFRAFLTSTVVPYPADHPESAAAMHPNLGQSFLPNLEGKLDSTVLKIGPEIAYNNGFIDSESCARLLPLVVTASLMNVSILSEDLQSGRVSQGTWREWMLLRVSLFAATSKGIKNCSSVLPFVESIWPQTYGIPYLSGTVLRGEYFNMETFNIRTTDLNWNLRVQVSREPEKIQKKSEKLGIRKARAF
jgi:hypothetical protein